jgi:hypothetical protein
MSALRKPEPAGCCSHACGQGRSCPIRQACELPEQLKPWRFHFGLKSWLLHLHHWYLRAAMAQMGPLHPDMPQAVRELHAVEDQLRRLG